MSLKIAINGFGRIGRAVLKIIHEKGYHIDVLAINDLTDNETLAHIFKYDTIYGVYPGKIKTAKGCLVIDNREYQILAEKDPENLPWRRMGIDLVIECTGFFTSYEMAFKHIKAGANKVVISAPSKSPEIKTFVLGVNDKELSKRDKIISNASCTTNSIAPLMQILEENIGIERAVMTTIHSYTADQNLVDGPHRKNDLRRARAAAENIVPTTTGAAISVTETIPSLENKFDGIAIRVPTPIVSLSDIVAVLKARTEASAINSLLRKESRTKRFKSILTTTDEPIVSSDVIKNPFSSIVDLSLTKVIDGELLKVIAWYDNEWGYANRLIELAMKFGKI